MNPRIFICKEKKTHCEVAWWPHALVTEMVSVITRVNLAELLSPLDLRGLVFQMRTFISYQSKGRGLDQMNFGPLGAREAAGEVERCSSESTLGCKCRGCGFWNQTTGIKAQLYHLKLWFADPRPMQVFPWKYWGRKGEGRLQHGGVQLVLSPLITAPSTRGLVSPVLPTPSMKCCKKEAHFTHLFVH